MSHLCQHSLTFIFIFGSQLFSFRVWVLVLPCVSVGCFNGIRIDGGRGGGDLGDIPQNNSDDFAS